MNKFLEELVDITLTPATVMNKEGMHNILKASSIKDGKIDIKEIEKGALKSGKEAKKHFLLKGDIVFQAKGSKVDATLIDQNIENLLSSQIFFNLRIKDKRVTPSFIHWYLNSPFALDYFATMSSSSVIKAVTKSTLAKLEVFVPEDEKQLQVITNLIKNFDKEKRETKQYLNDKEILVNETISKSINGGV